MTTKKRSNKIESTTNVIEIDEFDLDPWADIERQFDISRNLHKRKGLAAKRKIERWQEDRSLDRDDLDLMFASMDREERFSRY